jgi:hypothetical protein
MAKAISSDHFTIFGIRMAPMSSLDIRLLSSISDSHSEGKKSKLESLCNVCAEITQTSKHF